MIGEHASLEEKDQITIAVVYNKKLDCLGIHLGPKFIEYEEPIQPYWPHRIQLGGLTMLLTDKKFQEDYCYIGEL